MFFIFLVFFAALCLEGIGTYISIIGLSQVFTNSIIILGLMATLDLAKIVSASFLYKYWNKAHWFMKTYMLLAVMVTMIITSTGAFSYLSGQFQHAMEGTQQDTILLDSLTEEKGRLQKRKEEIDLQIKNLPSNYVRSRIALQDQFKEEVTRLNTRLIEIDKQLPELKSVALHKQVEVGPILYISEAFNTTPVKAIKWIILTIIFVFDPLAIALLVAGNFLIINRSKEKEDEKPKGKSGKEISDWLKQQHIDYSKQQETKASDKIPSPTNVQDGRIREHFDGPVDFSNQKISGLTSPVEPPITKKEIADKLIIAEDENGKLPLVQMEYNLSIKEPKQESNDTFTGTFTYPKDSLDKTLQEAITSIEEKTAKDQQNHAVITNEFLDELLNVKTEINHNLDLDHDLGRAMAVDDILDSHDHIDTDHDLGRAMAIEPEDLEKRDVVTLNDINKIQTTKVQELVKTSLEDVKPGAVSIYEELQHAPNTNLAKAYSEEYSPPLIPGRSY